MRIRSVTICRKAVKAPIYEQIVIENGRPALATFKFDYWSYDRMANKYLATFVRVE